jgi:flagellar basal-body rod protein FlgB
MSDSSIIFDRTIRLMQDRLSLNSLNQGVISGNLANINTPRYAAKEVSFERVLQDSLDETTIPLARSAEKHLDPGDLVAHVKSQEIVETGPVDLDTEMMKLAKNSIEYNYITTMLNKKFSLLRQAIGEGGQ